MFQTLQQMLAPDSVTPEPPALLPGEEEQLHQSTVMAGAPGALTPAAHPAVQHRFGKYRNSVSLFVNK